MKLVGKQRYRNSGQTFHHVSVFAKFTFFNLTYTYDVEIKTESCCKHLELRFVDKLMKMQNINFQGA